VHLAAVGQPELGDDLARAGGQLDGEERAAGGDVEGGGAELAPVEHHAHGQAHRPAVKPPAVAHLELVVRLHHDWNLSVRSRTPSIFPPDGFKRKHP
jgi:hypothetical protein